MTPTPTTPIAQRVAVAFSCSRHSNRCPDSAACRADVPSTPRAQLATTAPVRRKHILTQCCYGNTRGRRRSPATLTPRRATRAGTASVRPAASASSRNALHRIERQLGAGLGAERGQLLEDVGRRGDDVAAHLVRLDHVEDLARRGPDDLDIRRRARARDRVAASADGSRCRNRPAGRRTPTRKRARRRRAHRPRARPARP